MNITLRPPDVFRKFSTPLFAVILGVILISGALYWQQQQRTPATIAERMAAMPVSAEIETKYGVRISMVAVTADGGLIDLRYTVIDPDKAALMTDSLDALPVLVAGNGTSMAQRGAGHRHGQNLKAGISYFLLYTNEQNAIRPGDKVMVRVGDLHLDGVPVR
jgi:hypothetical protein